MKLPKIKLNSKYKNNIEWITPLIVLVISLFGIIAILNATANPFTGAENSVGDILDKLNFFYAARQAMWLGIGVVLMIIVNMIDYEFLSRIYLLIGAVALGLLAVILVAGYQSQGATSWLGIMQNKYGIQPSEFGKLAFIIVEATLMSRITDTKDIKQYLLPLGAFAVFFGLVMLQNDMGTAVAYAVIFAGILFVSGIQLRYIFILAGAAAVLAVVAWFFVLTPEQQSRITTFLNPGSDPLGDGYHVIQSQIAIGSGGVAGKGLFRAGTLSQLDYLPAKHTDFIFSVTAESFGFLGGIFIILLFIALLVRILYLSTRAKDTLGAMITIGVFAMLAYHVFENIGMTMGLMPITGIPLPFMSYGGSSFITNMMAIGLVMNVAMRRTKNNIFTDK